MRCSMENTLAFTQSQQRKRNVRIALARLPRSSAGHRGGWRVCIFGLGPHLWSGFWWPQCRWSAILGVLELCPFLRNGGNLSPLQSGHDVCSVDCGIVPKHLETPHRFVHRVEGAPYLTSALRDVAVAVHEHLLLFSLPPLQVSFKCQ